MWHHFNASFKRGFFCFVFSVHCHYLTIYGSDTNILILIRLPEMNYNTTFLCTTFVQYMSTLISSALAFFSLAHFELLKHHIHPAAACCPALSLNKVQIDILHQSAPSATRIFNSTLHKLLYVTCQSMFHFFFFYTVSVFHVNHVFI